MADMKEFLPQSWQSRLIHSNQKRAERDYSFSALFYLVFWREAALSPLEAATGGN